MKLIKKKGPKFFTAEGWRLKPKDRVAAEYDEGWFLGTLRYIDHAIYVDFDNGDKDRFPRAADLLVITGLTVKKCKAPIYSNCH